MILEPLIFSKKAFPKGRYDNGWWSINVLDKYNVLFIGKDSSYELNFKEILETGLDSNKKVGRNEKCPCGSGKKYKKCCATES